MGVAVIIPNVDFSRHGLGKVTLTSEIPLVSMSISGPTEVTGTNATYKALLYPGNTSERDVVWSVESGGAYASIGASSGVLTIDASADEATVVIKATSVDNSEIYATLALTVTYAGDSHGEDLSPGLTWEGGYINADYAVAASSVTKVSSPVQVQADDILFIKAIGTGMRALVECDSAGGNMKYGIFTRDWSYLSNVATYAYAYHVKDNGYVRFCSKEGNDIAFWKAGKIEDITPNWQSGYIDNSGNVQSSSVTSHSAPIPVQAGDIIVLKAAGWGLCLMALTNVSGSSYTPILQAPDPQRETNYNKYFFGPIRGASLTQPNTPSLGVWSNYQGESSPSNNPCTFAMYIEQDGYISVCAKTGLAYQLSRYRID